MLRVVLVPALLTILACDVDADRLYGNLNLLGEHSRQAGAVAFSDNSSQATLTLNYEDALFVKNRMRLGLQVSRRDYPNSPQRDLRPIFTLDLKSYGYALNLSYSPYRRLTTDAIGASTYYLYSRDWRSNLALNYDRYPPVNITYNRTRKFDRQTQRRFDSSGETFLIDTRHAVGGVAVRGSYGRVTSENFLIGGSNSVSENVAAAATLTKNYDGIGYLNALYSYYASEIDRRSLAVRNRTEFSAHTINALLSSDRFYGLTATTTYSGRWAESQTSTIRAQNDNHNATAQLSFLPLSYLSFDVAKSYQTTEEGGPRQTVEFVSISGSASRYLRQGVDTRLGATRTFFQKSNKSLESGEGGSGAYNYDNIYASVGLTPLNYVRTYFDVSVAHDSKPILKTQRYQVFRSLNAQLQLSRRIESRIGFTAVYQGANLNFDQSISRNYNLGLTWIPTGNLSLNANYIRTESATDIALSTDSWNGYASYSFRRAFTLFVNGVWQEQKTSAISPALLPSEVNRTSRPRSINSQILIYLTPSITLTGGYLYSLVEVLGGSYTLIESYQLSLNFRI